MRTETLKQYNAMQATLATNYGVESVKESFTVTPALEQRVQDKIVEQSTFLPLINVITVDNQKGENILGSASGRVSGRTDTSSTGTRAPKDIIGLSKVAYECEQTNSDVYVKYSTLDAWSHLDDFGERYGRYLQTAIANDREIIGWYGESVAATTDLEDNSMLQDVNKGWMQQMRDNYDENILSEGGTTGEIHFGTGGDYTNLDAAVCDLLDIIPMYLRKDLVVMVGSNLLALERTALFEAITDTPSEKALANIALNTFGGLPAMTPSNFPPNGLVITSLDNLSIYVQRGTWRRHLQNKPEKDRVEDYNSRNEAYVVECYEKFAAWDFKNVKFPAANSTWA